MRFNIGLSRALIKYYICLSSIVFNIIYVLIIMNLNKCVIIYKSKYVIFPLLNLVICWLPIFITLFVIISLLNISFENVIYCDSIPNSTFLSEERVNEVESSSYVSESYGSDMKCLGIFYKYKNVGKRRLF